MIRTLGLGAAASLKSLAVFGCLQSGQEGRRKERKKERVQESQVIERATERRWSRGRTVSAEPGVVVDRECVGAGEIEPFGGVDVLVGLIAHVP